MKAPSGFFSSSGVFKLRIPYSIRISLVSFKSFKNLPKAEKIWKNKCFDRKRKKLKGFSEPVTQAKAFSTWLNARVPLNHCFTLWNWGKSDDEPEKIDQQSLERMKDKLRKIMMRDAAAVDSDCSMDDSPR